MDLLQILGLVASAVSIIASLYIAYRKAQARQQDRYRQDQAHHDDQIAQLQSRVSVLEQQVETIESTLIKQGEISERMLEIVTTLRIDIAEIKTILTRAE
jgi:uncharacterized protein YlxW (UPF0749 family)